MPIEFSHPMLPSTVVPENLRVHLNTGDVVTSLYVAQNPNYDVNERQTVAAFGYFGNRLPSDGDRVSSIGGSETRISVSDNTEILD